MEGLRIDVPINGGAIVVSGVVLRIDREGTTNTSIRLRAQACDESGTVDPHAVVWREDIREGVHFLTRRTKSA